jgi:hypothetical protein
MIQHRPTWTISVILCGPILRLWVRVDDALGLESGRSSRLWLEVGGRSTDLGLGWFLHYAAFLTVYSRFLLATQGEPE